MHASEDSPHSHTTSAVMQSAPSAAVVASYVSATPSSDTPLSCAYPSDTESDSSEAAVSHAHAEDEAAHPSAEAVRHAAVPSSAAVSTTSRLDEQDDHPSATASSAHAIAHLRIDVPSEVSVSPISVDRSDEARAPTDAPRYARGAHTRTHRGALGGSGAPLLLAAR
jgi:hypothetical protein